MAWIRRPYYTPAEQADLDRLARQRTTDPQLLQGIIGQAWGQPPRRCERVVAGEVNEVYLLSPARGPRALLRINHLPGRDFQTETQVLERVREAGVPAPRVLQAGSYPGPAGPVHYSLQEELPGQPWDLLLWGPRWRLQMEPARVRRIAQNAGEVMSRLHTLPTSGYGLLLDVQRGQQPDRLAWAEAQLADPEACERALAHYGIPAGVWASIHQELLRAPQVLVAAPRLLHTDLGPKHLFVDDRDQIVGVIDWEWACSGDPVSDFERWDFGFGRWVPTSWLLEGYRRQADPGPGWEARWRLLRLSALLHLLRRYASEDTVGDAAQRAKAELLRLL